MSALENKTKMKRSVSQTVGSVSSVKAPAKPSVKASSNPKTKLVQVNLHDRIQTAEGYKRAQKRQVLEKRKDKWANAQNA